MWAVPVRSYFFSKSLLQSLPTNFSSKPSVAGFSNIYALRSSREHAFTFLLVCVMSSEEQRECEKLFNKLYHAHCCSSLINVSCLVTKMRKLEKG